MVVPSIDILEICSKLKSCKSAGPDGISAESLKCSHENLSVVLSLCFSLFVVQGYLPSAMIETCIIPINKNQMLQCL